MLFEVGLEAASAQVDPPVKGAEGTSAASLPFTDSPHPVSRKANVGAIPISLTLSPSMTRDALEAGASAAVTAGASAAVARRPHGSRHGAGSPVSWRPSRPRTLGLEGPGNRHGRGNFRSATRPSGGFRRSPPVAALPSRIPW